MEKASILESNGEVILECVETVHFPNQQARLDSIINPSGDLKMRKI